MQIGAKAEFLHKTLETLLTKSYDYNSQSNLYVIVKYLDSIWSNYTSGDNLLKQ